MAENRQRRSGKDIGRLKRHAQHPKQYSLKEREYKDERGATHHHTNVWMERHPGQRKQRRGSQRGSR